jgi:DUF1680 family protein
MKKIKILLTLSFMTILLSCHHRQEAFHHEEIQAYLPGQVRLLPGPFMDAQKRDAAYLLSLDPDRLLAEFRKTAGLDSVAQPYKGWEERELRGHTLGHYLSACSMMFAATGDTIFYDRCCYIASQLRECQEKNGNGYVSAFPESFIDRVEQCKPVWAPYYTLHKILAGLIDSYIFCHDSASLQVAEGMAEWLGKRCDKLSFEQMQQVLEHTEQGGTNEALCNLYAITGNRDYLHAAEQFYEHHYFDPMMERRDSLKGEHVNSLIPNVIGLARYYELTGDEDKKNIAEWFWNQVTSARSFVTGGTSNEECWNTEPMHMAKELGPASHESCCTYNMIKLSHHVFRWEGEEKVASYMERALWNGILPTQHITNGMTMYYVPMAGGYYKTFCTPESSFWCCTGTGMENFVRTNSYIYYSGNSKLFVNQFIPSELIDREEGISVVQQTDFPNAETVNLVIHTNRGREFELDLRIPQWITAPATIELNNRRLDVSCFPGSYAAIRRVWKEGDRITLTLPMGLQLSCLPDTPDTCAILFGPIVLAGRLGREGLTDEKTYGIYGPYNDKPVIVPTIDARGEMCSGLKQAGTEAMPLTFVVNIREAGQVELIPFYLLFGERYTIYWPVERR